MNPQTAGYLVIFGVIAILFGVIGYQTREERDLSALIFREEIGVLMLLCGILGARGVRLSWPIALLAVILFPLVWLLSLPLRLVGIALDAVFALVRTLLFLPARLLGWRKSECRA